VVTSEHGGTGTRQNTIRIRPIRINCRQQNSGAEKSEGGFNTNDHLVASGSAQHPAAKPFKPNCAREEPPHGEQATPDYLTMFPPVWQE
jgi:hypothetical protein